MLLFPKQAPNTIVTHSKVFFRLIPCPFLYMYQYLNVGIELSPSQMDACKRNQALLTGEYGAE